MYIRLHVSGINTKITKEDIINRFNKFGSVLNVDDITLDGNGDPRPYTFVDFDTTTSELNKCKCPLFQYMLSDKSIKKA